MLVKMKTFGFQQFFSPNILNETSRYGGKVTYQFGLIRVLDLVFIDSAALDATY